MTTNYVINTQIRREFLQITGTFQFHIIFCFSLENGWILMIIEFNFNAIKNLPTFSNEPYLKSGDLKHPNFKAHTI